MLFIILTFLRIGFESSHSNTRIFIYNTDTLLTFNRKAVFVSYTGNLNFLNFSIGKRYVSLFYNYEKSIFTSYGSFIKDSSTSFTNFFTSIKIPSKFLEFFYEKDGQYDTILNGGRFIGAAIRFSWPQNGMEFTYTGKYGLDAKGASFSFTFLTNRPLFSLFLLNTLERNNLIFLGNLTHDIYLSKDVYIENSINIFSKKAGFQSLAGINEVKAGIFMEKDFNENYTLSGLASSILGANKYLNFMLLSYAGYKCYSDTFFNTNTPHLETSGNFSIKLHGISLEITGALILEKESKSFYLTTFIAREF